MTDADELKNLLRNVSDTYGDFVHGVCASLSHEDPECTQDMIEFIKANPNATSSDIIEHLCELEGIEIPEMPEDGE